MIKLFLTATLSPIAMTLSSCSATVAGDSPEEASEPAPPDYAESPFATEEFGSFAEPWAATFEPGTPNIFITEKAGTMKFVNTVNRHLGTVTGLPKVAYAGQGGLGDVAFAPDYATSKAIYLTWAEEGPTTADADDQTRGAALGRGTLECEDHDSCEIRDLKVIWRQTPKVTGRGHYSHRIAFSPDGQYLFLSSGDRQKFTPAQDLSVTLGKVLRLNLDGTPAAGNPFAGQGSPTDEIWSYGQRNLLGMDFDLQGRLWEVEHGPRGGDELNLVEPGNNYGWPVRSYGIHYNGDPIPDHTADDGFTKPKAWWTPVIAPGDMTVVRSNRFAGWQGNLLIAGMRALGLVRIEIDGDTAREAGRYYLEARIRAVVEGADGALWVLEDGEEGRLLKLTPKAES